MQSLYEQLEVSPRVSRDVMQAAYRVLIRKHHPDVGGETRKAQALNAAYATLSDEALRRHYDAQHPDVFGPQAAAQDVEPKMVRVQCPGCGHVFIIRIGRFDKNLVSRTRCKKCGEAVFRDRVADPEPEGGNSAHTASSSADLGAYARPLIEAMRAKGWMGGAPGSGYFDAVLETPFFIKNFLYVKVVDELTEKTLDEVYSQYRACAETGGLLPTGHYVVVISRRIVGENRVVAKSGRMGSGRLMSRCSFIPVSLEKKKVFFHHPSRAGFPQDIATLDESVF